MPLQEYDRNMKNRVSIKTQSQKLGYLLKLVTLVYTLYCNVSWVYKHKDKQKS